MTTKRILVIGGSGIIGNSLCATLIHFGFSVYSLSLEADNDQNKLVNQIIVDRNNRDSFEVTINRLNTELGTWDAVIDLIPFGREDCNQLEKLISHNANHIIIISTTLVYNRESSCGPQYKIKEDHPLAELGDLGGYVDKKLEIEKYWRQSAYKNWTILRPYHILGKHSCLGCCPMHNRDPLLIARIIKEQPIKLSLGGNFEINFIHPYDLSLLIIKIIGNTKTFCLAYNAVYPDKVRVTDYYSLLASVVNKKINIQYLSNDELLSSDYGWELTAMNHIYDGEALYEVSGYIPQRDIDACIRDAVDSQSLNKSNHEAVRNRMNTPPKPTRYVLG